MSVLHRLSTVVTCREFFKARDVGPVIVMVIVIFVFRYNGVMR